MQTVFIGYPTLLCADSGTLPFTFFIYLSSLNANISHHEIL